jgi:hypothetical protein
MTILLRVKLNSCNTQMSQFDSMVIIQFFPHLKCSIGELIKYVINKSMHIIYFFGDKLYPLMNRLVHGKENVYKC